MRDLVSNLRRYHTQQTPEMGKAGFRGWHERGHLPHYDVPNVTQFVTFRLADSIAAPMFERIMVLENDRKRRHRLEATLDQGHGACHLRRPEIGSLVQGALLFFHGQRYELRAWCVMPNHVHVLVHVKNLPLSEIAESWKSYTSLQANRLLKREGQPFWQAGYFDTYIRNSLHESQTIRYIEQNPCKAKLILNAKEWQRSSARLRDEFGRLNLPTVSGKPTPRSAPILGAAAPPDSDATSITPNSSKANALRPGRPRSDSTGPSERNAPILGATDSQAGNVTSDSKALSPVDALRPGRRRAGAALWRAAQAERPRSAEARRTSES